MKALILLFLIPFLGYSQTIFLETFNEADGSTSGADDVGGVSWSTTCPYSIATDDYFKIVSGVLEGRDTNGPAEFTTGDINTSSCTNTIQIEMDLSEVGVMEETGGCNSVDMIKLEYSTDGGNNWSVVSDILQGGTTAVDTVIYSTAPCVNEDVVGPFIMVGDFGELTYSACIYPTPSLKLRITVMNWAGTEKHRIDNLKVSCSNCITPLPIELVDFDGYSKDKVNKIYWVTASELNNDYFILERSEDGIHWSELTRRNGAGNSTTAITYDYTDENPFIMTTYYRLSQVDFDGVSEMFDIIAITNESQVFYTYSKPEDNNIYLSSPEYFEFYNTMGQVIISGTGKVIETESLTQGIYILKIGIGYTQKFFVR
jgi:hypothetical protein